jgi:hypothetical protein
VLNLTMFLSLVLVAFAWPVKAETDGSTWVKQSEEFKRGYSAGQLDTQIAWGAALLATPPASNEMKKTLEAVDQVASHTSLCVRTKGISPDQLKKLEWSLVRVSQFATTIRNASLRINQLEEDSRLTPCDVGTGGGVKG